MSQQPVSERVIAQLRPHPRAVFWPSVVLIAVVGATAFFTGRFEALWLNLLVLAVGLALVILFWALPMVAWLNKRYIITTRRLIVRRGLFLRERQELLHSRGYDVTVRAGLLQRGFRSGDVLVNIGLEEPVRLRDVPLANLVQSTLHDLMENSLGTVAARRRQEAGAARDADETVAWGER